MRMRRTGIWKWAVALGALLAGGFACNTHELNPFEAAVRVSQVEETEAGEVRPVDILFVVDSSNSMCEEQARLEENFNAFLEVLAQANADFQLAVISTDMVDFVQGTGVFHTSPGTYNLSSGCSIALPDTSSCPASVGPVLKASEYRSGDTFDIARLQADFRCMALTGIDGNGVEMGLEAMRQALSKPSQKQAFLRDNALLAVVFVTDENDCSDGTIGAQHGTVYARTLNGGTDVTCEYSRNIEDACLYATQDTLSYDPQGRAKLEKFAGMQITHNGETKSARQWCNEGRRELVTALADQLDLKCETGAEGCNNGLTPRLEYYNFLVNLMAEKNYGDLLKTNEEQAREAAARDIIIAAIINNDGGVRYNSTETVSSWCGVGQQGYRYQQLAEMFDQDRQVIAPICDRATGEPTEFAPSLELIAETIGRALNSLCLQRMPMTCNTDADCPGQGTDAAQTCNQVYFAGSQGAEYRVCSGFTVRVEQVTSFDEEGNPLTTRLMQEGVDYTIDMENVECMRTNQVPMQLAFISAPEAGSRLIVSYPRAVRAVND